MSTSSSRRAELILKVLHTLRIDIWGDLFELEQR
jgi:hypothetical protein